MTTTNREAHASKIVLVHSAQTTERIEGQTVSNTDLPKIITDVRVGETSLQ